MTTKNTNNNEPFSEPISRRDFAATTTGVLSLLGAMAGGTESAEAAATDAPKASSAPYDIAEWSYFWVGNERAPLSKGSIVGGKQMYVEYWIPTVVKHPIPIVLVHGGGGQGLDWIGTPDGRPGWAPLLLQQGYKVYVVDRPGHGRSPLHPEMHGAFPATAGVLENISGRFTPPNPTASNKPGPYQHFMNQWVGKGDVGSPDLDQFVASQGGSYVTVPAPPGAPGGRGAAPANGAVPPPPPAGNFEPQHMVWRERGAMLLDKIGPAIIITHSAGGPFGWLVAEIRPNLVKGIIAVEGGGTPFTGQNVWGMSTIPVAYDPPINDPSELKLVAVTPTELGVGPYKLQAEPARKLKNMQGIPIVIVTSEGSFAAPGNPGGVAYFKQAGCKAEELRLVDHNIHGNGHMMMCERNNKEVLAVITDWIEKNVPKNVKAPAMKRSTDSTAMKLADMGFFWVGTEHKKMPYGTILAGQTYVQYLIPSEVRHETPIVLVHGGSGQMLHYMGSGDGLAGWAHYYVQAGYKVYLIDRPGHGRAPYHPDALGPIANQPSYGAILPDFKRSARGPNRQWSGSAEEGSDPVLDQFMASQNAPPANNVFAHGLWATRGAALLDKIGPAIIQVHSAGGPFGYLVANERPGMVKAIINVEGGGAAFAGPNVWGLTDTPMVYDPPVSDPTQLKTRDMTSSDGVAYKLQADPPRRLKNLVGIPIVYVTSEMSGRNGGPAHVEFLKQAGCDAEHVALKDKGIRGNGHFMMIENNRKQVFEAIRTWVETKVPAQKTA
jgi:pimeloyl-ACP methyl ester carboxylesterase